MTSNNGDGSSSWKKGQVMLRILAAIFALSGIILMVTSSESTIVYGFKFQAKYHYSSAFRFLVGVDIVVGLFSMISLIVICAACGPTSSNSKAYFFLFLHDLVTMVLAISGCAAATAVGYIGRYGQNETGWTKICDHAHKFCNYNSLSVACSYLAFLCLFLLTIMAFKRPHQTSC